MAATSSLRDMRISDNVAIDSQSAGRILARFAIVAARTIMENAWVGLPDLHNAKAFRLRRRI